MKGRLAAALAAVMLLGVGLAVAVGGLGGDPLISKSYFEDIYLPDLAAGLRGRAEQGMAPALEKAVKALEAQNQTRLEKAGELQGEKSAYAPVSLGAGDSLELTCGSAAVLADGACRLDAGALADVTRGSGVKAGEALICHHRYIVTSEGGATLRLTEGGAVLYQGTGTARRGDVGGQTGPGSPGGPGAEDSFPFADVPREMWYRAAVAFVYEKGYFSGTGADTFSPEAPMDRAMVATVLHRVSGGKKTASDVKFTDVPEGEWYSDGIAWASANGVVNGMGGGLYEPHRPVTREQLVTMLYRYEKDYRKADVSGTAPLDGFADGQEISSWARDAVGWAVDAGLLRGRDNGCLDPLGTATRAEVATILQRFSGRL